MSDTLVKKNISLYEELLKDESGLKGSAESISFPKTQEELIQVVQEMAKAGQTITIQGGNTGIYGGAVPQGGHVVNLSQLTAISGLRKTEQGYLIRVEAGVRLKDLTNLLSSKKFKTESWDEQSLLDLAELKKDKEYFWPPNPTETLATIGGILATNACGTGDWTYGKTGKFVEELLIINSSGQKIALKRGEETSQALKKLGLTLEEFYIQAKMIGLVPNADLIDLFLGSEGIFGFIAEAVLRLVPRSAEQWSIAFLFSDEKQLFDFTEELKSLKSDKTNATIAVLEYLDQVTLSHIDTLGKSQPALQKLPVVDEQCVGMVMSEIHGPDESSVMEIAEQLLAIASKYHCNDKDTWALTEPHEVEMMRSFRHAAPESLNLVLKQLRSKNPALQQLTTDWCLPELSLAEAVDFYRKDAKTEGISLAIYGHLYSNRLNINLLPDCVEDFPKVSRLLNKWAESITNSMNIDFLHHSIGKLRKNLFAKYTDHLKLEAIKKVRQTLNPDNRINQGNVLD